MRPASFSMTSMCALRSGSGLPGLGAGNSATRPARNAAQRQHLEGATASISYQDQGGHWHTEVAKGGDRPDTAVVDRADGTHKEEPSASIASSNSPAEPE